MPVNSNESNASAIAHDEQPRKVSSVYVITVDDAKITDNHTIPMIWLSLSNMTLMDDDQSIILREKKLNNKHIYYEQMLIKKQFENIQGLASTSSFQAENVHLYRVVPY